MFLGIINLLLYFIIAIVIVLSIRKLTNIPNEIFRKLLHFVLLGSLVVWSISFHSAEEKIITSIGFVILAYPILMFFERFKTYSKLLTERKSGELKSSLIIVFLMFALVVFVCEGIFGDVYLTLASIFAWGAGDAFAAIIGKKYGKHKLRGKFLDGKKSLEGTLSMFLVSFLSVLFILHLRCGFISLFYIFVAIVVAIVSAITELYSKDGHDTILCPIFAMFTLLFLLLVKGELVLWII